MLAELAIANAAFAIIKQTLSNGGELLSAGKAVGEYFAAEKAIAKEQLRIQEEELKFMLNKQRLQGYHDFLEFKQQYTRDLREAEKDKARKRYKRQQVIEENVTVALKAMGIIAIIMGAAFGVAIYLR